MGVYPLNHEGKWYTTEAQSSQSLQGRVQLQFVLGICVFIPSRMRYIFHGKTLVDKGILEKHLFQHGHGSDNTRLTTRRKPVQLQL